MTFAFAVPAQAPVTFKQPEAQPLASKEFGVSAANTAVREASSDTYAATDEALPDELARAIELFDNAAELKINMSQIAMHLPMRWRDSVRKQIDRLLASEDWDEGSSSIGLPSFRTFLRFLAFSTPANLAGLGVSPTGTLLAAWHRDGKRVSVEFVAGDRANCVVAGPTERDHEVIAWQGHVGELTQFIVRVGYAGCLG